MPESRLRLGFPLALITNLIRLHCSTYKFILFLQNKTDTIIYIMCTTTLHLHIDENLNNKSFKVFENPCRDLPTAIRIFLRNSAMNDRRMPFELKNKRCKSDRIPYSGTLEGLKEQLIVSMNEVAESKIRSEEKMSHLYMI